LTSACGGGGGAAPPAVSLAPHAGPISYAEAQHFLIRTQFGASRADIEELLELGVDAWLERALAFETDKVLEESALDEIENRERPREDEVVRWWLHLMVRTSNPLQEALALFWHDHFGVSQRAFGSSQRHMMIDHVNLLRRRGNGSLRDLLYEVAVDPAMLVFLNGVDSTREKPNENFPREFFELFALGVDNGYTQSDVENTARAFTGYRQRYDSSARQNFVTWDEERHDDEPKTVFGTTGLYGYRELIDLTIDERQVAEHVCKKLFEHFCHDDPAPSLVAEMAAFLRGSDYELKPLLRKLLSSRAFFSSASRMNQVKSPVEFIVGLIRTTGLEPPFYDLDEGLLAAGQRPTQPPSVAGWPGGLNWLGSAHMLERGNLANTLITDSRAPESALAQPLGPRPSVA